MFTYDPMMFIRTFKIQESRNFIRTTCQNVVAMSQCGTTIVMGTWCNSFESSLTHRLCIIDYP